MNQEERLAKIRAFLEREDLEGTELKLKTQVVELDQKLAGSRADYQKLTKELEQLNNTANNKQVEILSLSSRLEGLCELVLSLGAEEVEEKGAEEE